MFWRLCVIDENKTSNLCFITIKKAKTFLPVAYLFDAIVKANEQIAVPLVEPIDMKNMLCGERSHVWRAYNERSFAELDPERIAARRWWHSGQSTLIWSQRAYLDRQFPDFDPASGRDDDTPYDVDHMVPYSDWGRHWAPAKMKTVLPGLSVSEREAIKGPRFLLGDSIGNLRLIDFSVNRAAQDDPFMTKLKKEFPPEASAGDEIAYHCSMAFDPKAKDLWEKASGGEDRIWPNERLIDFQQAVEERAAWLYNKLYSELDFVSWKDRAIEVSPSAQ
jgi:hypothetical protein